MNYLFTNYYSLSVSELEYRVLKMHALISTINNDLRKEKPVLQVYEGERILTSLLK